MRLGEPQSLQQIPIHLFEHDHLPGPSNLSSEIVRTLPLISPDSPGDFEVQDALENTTNPMFKSPLDPGLLTLIKNNPSLTQSCINDILHPFREFTNEKVPVDSRTFLHTPRDLSRDIKTLKSGGAILSLWSSKVN